MTIPILDSHVHLIDPERLSYRWLPEGMRCDAGGTLPGTPLRLPGSPG
jgi:predicted TIM-barrel fold metal-dependent hydrolase